MPAAPRLARDPTVTIAVVALWLLLALFVVYPLVMLFTRVLIDHGTFNTAGVSRS